MRSLNSYEDMILVELIGGMGNQMFQYAAAKSLALHHHVELKLVTNNTGKKIPEGIQQRQFDLHHFHLPDPFATAAEINLLSSISLMEKIREKARPNHKRKIYREPFFHYDVNFFDAGPNVFLKGLWQSEKYFDKYKTDIRHTFRCKEDVIKSFKDVVEKMNQQHSVALHIRRGDYLAKVSLQVLGLVPIEYYKKSIALLSSKINDPVFYIFSDDIGWARENLKIDSAVFVSGSITKHHIEDLYLMSRCKHNIIANSSFSWWGAWLNNNPNKIIIAPRKWFNKGPKDTQDLLPDEWIKI